MILKRLCQRCQKPRKRSQYKHPNSAICRPCKNQISRLRNPVKFKDKFLKYKFGLVPGMYQIKAAAQNFRCAICGMHQTELKRALAVDHDHKTNQIRDLLCGSCNPLLGYAKDSIDLLQMAIRYLEKWHVKTNQNLNLTLSQQSI